MPSLSLNDEQLDAVSYDGNCVILAGPGSGKTRVLSAKVAKTLSSLPGYQGVVAISYTNKASDELRDRVRALVSETKQSLFGTIDRFYLREVVYPFGGVLFGNRPLRDVEITNESTAELVQPISDLKSYVHSVHAMNPDPERAPEETIRRAPLDAVRAAVEAGNLHLRCTSSLAYLTILASQGCRRYLKSRYTHLYVDEYQDSDAEQHALFMLLVKMGLKMVAVGDLNQSIFGFGGKDARFLSELQGREDFALKVLTTNHRSHPSIQQYARILMGQEEAPCPAADPRVHWLHVHGDDATTCQWIEASLDEVMARFQVSARGQVAILVRSNASLARVSAALTIPHQVHISTPLDENRTEEARVCGRIVAYWLGDEEVAFELIQESFDLSTAYGRAKATAFRHQLGASREQFRQGELNEAVGITQALVSSLGFIGWNEELQADLHQTLVDPRLGDAFGRPDNNRIQVLTLHKSKGLEYDIVFHLDCHQWVLPGYKSLSRDFSQAVREHEKRQDLNLHYVGVTRARKAAYLVYQNTRYTAEGEERRGQRSEFLHPALAPYAVQLDSHL